MSALPGGPETAQRSGKESDRRIWNIDHSLELERKLSCAERGSESAPCWIDFVVNGDLELLAGSGIEAERGLRLQVEGDLVLAPGAYLSALDGGIEIAAGGRVVIDGLVTASAGTGSEAPAIVVRTAEESGGAVSVGSSGILISEANRRGGAAVQLSGCGIEIRGLVAAVSEGPKALVEMRSCKGLAVDGRDLEAIMKRPGARQGQIEAVATEGNALLELQARESVDLDGSSLRTGGRAEGRLVVGSQLGEIRWRDGKARVSPTDPHGEKGAGPLGRIELSSCLGADLRRTSLEPAAGMRLVSSCHDPDEKTEDVGPESAATPGAAVGPFAVASESTAGAAGTCDPDLLLSGDVDTEKEFVACRNLEAVSFNVLAGGDVTFRAGSLVSLEDFSVHQAGTFEAGIDPSLLVPFRAVKIEDLDQDGDPDDYYIEGSEPLIDGWEFSVYDESDNLLTTVTTQDQGSGTPQIRAELGSYAVGDTIKICETLQTGWVNTLPADLDPAIGKPCFTQIVPNVSGPVTFDFLNFLQEVELWAVKVHDEDRDGDADDFYDPGGTEQALEGWEISVYDENNNLLASDITADRGSGSPQIRAEFGVLAAGTAIKVCETLQPNWVHTIPNVPLDPVLGKPCNSTTVPDSLGPGPITYNFFNYDSSVTLWAVKVNDEDRDGDADDFYGPGGTEQALEGWEISVYDENNNLLASDITADRGSGNPQIRAELGVFAGGTAIKVCETLQPNWVNTIPDVPLDPVLGKPCNSTTVPDLVGIGQITYNFFNFEDVVPLQAIKIHDLDKDGDPDDYYTAGTEPLLSGWKIVVYDDGLNELATVLTQAQASGSPPIRADLGTYPAGTVLKVCEVLEPGWTPTLPGTIDPVVGEPCHDLTVPSVVGPLTLDFLNFE